MGFLSGVVQSCLPSVAVKTSLFSRFAVLAVAEGSLVVLAVSLERSLAAKGPWRRGRQLIASNIWDPM